MAAFVDVSKCRSAVEGMGLSSRTGAGELKRIRPPLSIFKSPPGPSLPAPRSRRSTKCSAPSFDFDASTQDEIQQSSCSIIETDFVLYAISWFSSIDRSSSLSCLRNISCLEWKHSDIWARKPLSRSRTPPAPQNFRPYLVCQVWTSFPSPPPGWNGQT